MKAANDPKVVRLNVQRGPYPGLWPSHPRCRAARFPLSVSSKRQGVNERFLGLSCQWAIEVQPDSQIKSNCGCAMCLARLPILLTIWLECRTAPPRQPASSLAGSTTTTYLLPPMLVHTYLIMYVDMLRPNLDVGQTLHSAVAFSAFPAKA